MEYATLDPNRLIMLVTGGGDDPENTLSLLLRYFANAPPFMHAFIGWFDTAHGRLATDEGRINIEASPNPGRVYVEGALTDNDFSTFLTVCLDNRKRPLPLLSIAGGPDDFDNFARSVAQHDNEYDINFQTTIKYLVARYNHYAGSTGQPQMPIRHSLLETDGSEMQKIFEMMPLQYLEATVLTFDDLHPTETEQQFRNRLDRSMIRPMYDRLVVMYQTYRDFYLDMIQKCIDMLVPEPIRLNEEFRKDIEAFSPTLLRQFPHFNVDRSEFLRMLYAGLIERGTFPWATRDNDLALLQELQDGLYNIPTLQTIAGDSFGMTLQLIATGLYYLFFVIIKMYPRYARMKSAYFSIAIAVASTLELLNLSFHLKILSPFVIVLKYLLNIVDNSLSSDTIVSFSTRRILSSKICGMRTTLHSAESLLDAFCDDLLSSGAMDNRMAVQHRNYVELVWAMLDKNMVVLPLNALSNLHLLRDFYHRPSVASIGKKHGVQASTIRSRYTSLSFFLQFLRKQQVFAGMSRAQIQLLSETITDFNKELNPFIKRRKVDVRRNKVKQLLTPGHFIKYGQSEFVQQLISTVKRDKQRSKMITSEFARQFRDYLITSIAITNGLRPSNIMELRINDLQQCQDVEDYPGHKILVNAKYKTSTIYGEKFIVIPQATFLHLKFYVEKVRNRIGNVKSSRLFLSSGRSTHMNQTNISSSITSSFKLAKVFGIREYKRVTCTRIRCGIATYACNEGGFDTAFFAKHIMKNREEITNMHYNLLSNKRHAINIAMKLYSSFTDEKNTVSLKEKEVEHLTSDIAKLGLSAKKENVIEWLKKACIDISNNELKDMKCMLDELEMEVEPVLSKKVFYSKTYEEKVIYGVSLLFVLFLYFSRWLTITS